MSIESSWNPAFRPNTASSDATEALAQRPERETDQIIIPLRSYPEEEQPDFPNYDDHGLLENARSAEPDQSEVKVPVKAIKAEFPADNGHPELENSQGAVEQSLANSGGGEPKCDSLHNGEKEEAEGGRPAEVPPSEKPKAEPLPPTVPPHELGHSSSESFSRTVTNVLQESPCGEDDEVDPEWNLRRTETDPFKFMAPSDRTNSFPAVQRANPIPVTGKEPLAQTQAESMILELEESKDDDFFNHDRGEHEAAASSGFRNEGDNEHQSQDEYGKSFGGDIGEQDVGSRYEEGVPLISHHDQFGSSQGAEYGAIGDDGVDEEEDFFNQIAMNSENESTKDIGYRKLDRKSTMQVMDSLHIQQRVSSLQKRDIDDARTPLEHISEDTTLMEASISEDPDADFFERRVETATEPTEEELAAKWQAELGEDELLEDDDFLPDDETERQGANPTSFFSSDDEGFLDDPKKMEQLPRGRANGQELDLNQLSGNSQLSQQNPYVPSAAIQNVPPQQNRTQYGPAVPQFTDLPNNRPGMASYATAPYGYSAPNNSTGPPVSLGQQPPQRPNIPKAQSFADKAKGGYSSPYDLPMDLKPKTRPSYNPISRGFGNQSMPSSGPPRSNSMDPQLLPASQGSASSMSPPTSSHPHQQVPRPSQRMSMPPPIQIAPPTLKSKGSFFEELPIVSRPKPPGRYTPQPSPSVNPGSAHTPSNIAPQAQLPPTHSYAAPSQKQSQIPVSVQDLVAPSKVNPYAPVHNASAPQVPQIPAASQRYSPAVARNTSAPPIQASSRYSPAPHQPPVTYVPRTSSPLAHFSASSNSGPNSQPLGRSFSQDAPPRLAPTQEIDENQEQAHHYKGQVSQDPVKHPKRTTPPPTHSARSSAPAATRTIPNNYEPISQLQTSPTRTFIPPPRAQTQSPSAAARGLRLGSPEQHERPGTVHHPTSYSAGTFQSMTASPLNVPRTRPAAQNKNYIPPNDGREHDELQRWKGCPIFIWGAGGSVITSFPVEVPRYVQGHNTPMYICSPGQVKIRNVKDVLQLGQRLASFPGPLLKAKAKKKDVITWLGAGIEALEKEYGYLSSLPWLSHEDKRNEERVLLWKVLKTFVENDGVLEGNPTVDSAVRSILSPSVDLQSGTVQPLYATGADLSGIVPSANSQVRAEAVNLAAVDELRKHLLRGDRTKAVWEAVEHRLWAHAMLISNTVSKELYKQVAQEFVQKEVKNIGENTESLAALYEIFAGNFEESIDELVAPSARAGRQFMSTGNADAKLSKGALDGLDRWRETLGLVLSNRSIDDSRALNALGKLLSGYGRAEAAHICFLFARSLSPFGGIDDPTSCIVLIGADHNRQPNDFAKDLEPILLSEVYEYGSSLSSTSNILVSSPHLAVYKLQHAKMLAEYGLREKAIAYCDAISASITSQTKRSPYHHPLLISSVDDLTQRLKSAKDESNSWISKPSISAWNTFTKFVVGEDNDDTAAGAGADGSTQIGPFAKIAGGTPTISRSPSQADIYNPYNVGSTAIGGIPIPGGRAASRYAPGASYIPPEQTSNSYGSQQRRSFEQAPRSSDELRRGSYEPVRHSSEYTRPASQAGSITNGYAGQLRQHPQYSQNHYTPITDGPYSGTSSTLQQSSSYSSTPASSIAASQSFPASAHVGSKKSTYEPVGASSGYEPSDTTGSPKDQRYQPLSSDTGYDPETTAGYEPPSSSGYEPPSNSGYEPPSYNTSYEPEPDSPVDTRPKKKNFMDDDDDDHPSAASTKPRERTKAEIDREVDEAFRKAAEEDAKRDAEKPVKKGWGLTGWFSSKKESSQDMSAPNKPIKAKLGEESSFVYDPDLKRWINKRDKGSTTERPSATPPPRKGPSRTSSGVGGPPQSRPGSAASFIQPQPLITMERSKSSDIPSPTSERPTLESKDNMMGLSASRASFQRTISNSSFGGPAGPGTAPPSRPATGMSNASSLDDLLGPATGGTRRGAAGGKGKKKGRYVDVFPTGGAAS